MSLGSEPNPFRRAYARACKCMIECGLFFLKKKYNLVILPSLFWKSGLNVFFLNLKTQFWFKTQKKHSMNLDKSILGLKNPKQNHPKTWNQSGTKNLFKFRYIFLGTFKVKLLSSNGIIWHKNQLFWWPKSMSTIVFPLYHWIQQSLSLSLSHLVN
jgi:hypothetical protein